MATEIDKFRAGWDFRGHRGLIQLKGADGKVQSFRVNDPAEFSAAVELLRGAEQAVMEDNKIFIGAEDIGED